MTIKTFVDRYIGTKIDYDKQFGAQCTDVFRQYCADVLQIPHTGGVEGAQDLYLNYAKLPLEVKFFERVPNTRDFIPQEGDVAIYKAVAANKFGHVAIVLWGSLKVMTVFEQDGFKQDGAKIVNRDYTHILGFLRRRTA